MDDTGECLSCDKLADMVAALRAEVATLNAALDAKIDVQCDTAVLALKAECEDHRQQLIKEQLTAQQLHDICRDAYEVWAGSEGIPEPTTCSEAYLLQLLLQMRDEVKRGLR